MSLRFLLVLGLALSAVGGLHAERLAIRGYGSEDGLPSDSIYRARTDPQGFLWFLTEEGLARFDGHEFTTFGPEQGLPRGLALDFLETRDGLVLVATTSGVYELRTEPGDASVRFERIGRKESDLAVWAEVFFEDSAGRVWCGLNIGLFLLEGRDGQHYLQRIDLSPYQQTDIYHVTSLAEEEDGSMWIGVRDAGGLLRRLSDGRLEHYDRSNGLPKEDIRSLLLDSHGTVWVGTSDGLCTLVDDPRPGERIVSRCYGESDGLGGNWIWRIMEDSAGRLWFGTTGGLARYRGGPGQGRATFRTYGPANGIPARIVMGLVEDVEGNLWVGTDVRGVAKLATDGLVTYGVEDGLESSTVALLEDRDGSVCALTGVGGTAISCFDDERFRNVHPRVPAGHSGRGWGWGQLHLQDSAGHWWITTFDGLYRFPVVSSLSELAEVSPDRVYNSENGLLDETVFRLFEDSRGDLWVGTIHGQGLPHLYRWRRTSETIESLLFEQGVPGDAPTAFAEDGDGTVWVGSYHGLRRFRNGRFELLGESNGVPRSFVERLLLDSSGKLWAAMPQHGVLVIDEPAAEVPVARAYTTEEGLSNNLARCLVEDRFGRIYIGTNRGVDRLEPASGHVRHYSTADGLSAPNIVDALEDSEGFIWFGTSLGASRLDPRPDRQARVPPVWISGLRVAGRAHQISPFGAATVPRLEMAPDERQIEIEFSSLGLRTGDRLRFQYRLEGGGSGWSRPAMERKVNFANLAPGPYRFEVRALNSEGLVSSQPAVVSFHILPPVWRRWWFVLLCLTATAGAAYGLHRLRLRRVVELERVRTRIATDLHDDIGASLSQVSILSEVASQRIDGSEPAAAKPLLAQIAGTSRELVDAMGDIVWAINPKQDRAGDLVQRMRRFASDTFTGKGVRLRFSAPEDGRRRRLGIELRRQIFLIFKEAVNNAARHSGCSEAAVSFRVDGNRLVLEVSDNGRGFDIDDSSHGNGLASMGRRAEELRGALEVTTAAGHGTTVRLEAPLDF